MKTMQMKRTATIAALGGVLLTMAAACSTMGTGNGELTRGGGPVSFDWNATGADTSGSMSARLADGREFSGPFVQMTRERRVDLDPLWIGWPYRWNDWRWGAFGPDVGFETVYSGKVVANLKGPDNDRMRCRFTLDDPISGMSGGGQGQCQLTDGRQVDAVFPRA